MEEAPQTTNNELSDQLANDFPNLTEQMPSYEEHMKEILQEKEAKEVSPEASRQFGAKVLSSVGFEHKKIVESSFNKARAQGEKLPGRNNERRNLSYLRRVEGIMEEHGEESERRLWELSADKLIIRPDEIEESYWRQHERFLREHGQGRQLDENEKRLQSAILAQTQRNTLKPWVDLFSSKESQYPAWFKIYAWDGISKMGTFNIDRQKFTRRDEHSVAQFPELDQDALKKVYDEIMSLGSSNGNISSAANFNNIYSKYYTEGNIILKTPEKTSDVRGQWVEYGVGEEKKLAAAAKSTPWCIANSETAKGYLEDEGFDEDGSTPGSKAKFYLFHLQDPKRGVTSQVGAASIRLGFNGKVAEISGLLEGQALEPALIPIVREKTLSLPGGKEYLKAFDDNEILCAIDKKMELGEPLSKKELEFIYETKRPIKSLNGQDDPRVDEVKEKYDIGYAISSGISPKKLFKAINNRGEVTSEEIQTFINHGLNAKKITAVLDSADIVSNLDVLEQNGAKVNVPALLKKLEVSDIVPNIVSLNKYGANIDVDKFINNLDDDTMMWNFGKLLDQGIQMDLKRVIPKDPAFMPTFLNVGFGEYIRRGGNPEDVIAKLTPEQMQDKIIRKLLSKHILLEGQNSPAN